MSCGRNKTQPLCAVLLCAAALGVAAAVFIVLPPKSAPEGPVREIGFKDGDVLLYLEALSRIQQDALFLGADVSRKRIIQDTLKAYLQNRDTASDYLTAEEYASFKAAQDERYVGIGLEITKNRNGDVLAFPYPNGAAEKAGIVPGDRITHIDAVPVAGKSLFSLASLARGRPGTTLRLTLQSRSGVVRELSITRAEAIVANVSRQWFDKTPVIKIVSFTRNTKGDLANILRNRGGSEPIVIDLRDNGGGDLNAAIDSSMLFLQPGRKIVTVETRKSPRTYVSSNRAADAKSPLYLWQDEETASAAEVFIAALTQNGRAVSIGKKTFGKGTKQDIIELSDGSALILTTGYLLTPDGTDFRERGLEPSYPLAENEPDTGLFVAKLRQLMGTGRVGPRDPGRRDARN